MPGAGFTLVHVDVPVAEVQRRRERNLQTGERGNVRDEDLAEVVAGWQEPEADEWAVRYNPSVPMTELVRRLTTRTEHG